MSNTDPLEVQLLDTDLQTVLALLPADGTNLFLQLNEPGSGACRLPVTSAAASQVAAGQFVRINYRGANRGGFFVENTRQVDASQAEGGDRWLQISGRGALAILEEGIVWTDGTAETTRTFTSQTKAAILKTLIDEAQARGALSILTYDFTAVVDSSTVAWTDSETMELGVGTTLLEVVRQFAGMGIDFDIELETDGTFTLHAYKNGKGTDKSSTLYFRVGTNCEDANQADLASQLHNAYLVKYGTGYTYTADAASISSYRRREKLYHADETNNPNTALSFANVNKNIEKDPQSALYLKINDGVSPLAFVDYVLGDTVRTDRHGTESDYRIRGMQLSWMGDRQYADVIVTNNTTILENQLRVSQEVERLKRLITQAHDAGLLEVSYWAALSPIDMVSGAARGANLVQVGTKIYLSGYFAIPGYANPTIVAQYDITTGIVIPAGAGYSGQSVEAFAVHGTDIYFGANDFDGFSNPISRLVKLDTTDDSFTIVDANLINGTVYDIVVDGNKIYVGGNFIDPATAGYAPITMVGLYDLDAPGWQAVGALDGIVRALAVQGSDLIAGGEFTDKISAWGGAAWATLGGGLDGNVYALAASTDLYVGGDFTDRLTVWDGANFTSMTGVNETVRGIVISALGEIYIVGDFTAPGNYIAMWNGTVWVELGTGLNNTGNHAIINDTDVYVVGEFTQAGGKAALGAAVYFNNFENLLDHLSNHSSTAQWGQIVGDIDDQLDLIARLALKLSIAGNTANRIMVTDGSGNITTDSDLAYDAANNVFKFGGEPPLFGTTPNTHHQIGVDAASAIRYQWVFSDTLTSSPYNAGMRAGGTKASPTAVLLGMYLNRFGGRGYEGANWSNSQAELRLIATENWSASVMGARPQLWGTANGDTEEQDVTGVRQRTLQSNLTLNDGECLVLGGYLNVGDYGLTLNGDSGVTIL